MSNDRLEAYLNTVERLEPDISMIDSSYGWASIAISLKRIADAAESISANLSYLRGEFEKELEKEKLTK